MKTSTLFVAALSTAASATAPQVGQGSKDVRNMSIEDLMKVEVTTVSKSAQSLQNVAAAIYVITPEEIRRSGARSIPEALRLVPGVQVAQLTTSQWQISIRGGDSVYADKLLVMIDGRSVYNTTFDGVYWDTQEINLEDIARIEVIRGTGGSLWGTNAVNGIINVITKQAQDTQGFSVTASSSTLRPEETSVRYGGKFGGNGAFRVYGKAFGEAGLDTIYGPAAHDSWSDLRAGFRADWSSGNNTFALMAGANSEHIGSTTSGPILTPPYSQLFTREYPASDQNVTFRWTRKSGMWNGATLQVSASHDDRVDPFFAEDNHTLAADFQMPTELARNNQLTWGFGFRSIGNSYMSGPFASSSVDSLTENTLSAFLEDSWKLADRVTVSGGVKAEHNRFTGWEIQPSASFAWSLRQGQTVWGSVSRSVRTPSITDEYINEYLAVTPTANGPAEIILVGSPNFRSEAVVSDELGWRYAPSAQLLFDAAVFYSQYTDYRTLTPLAPTVTAGANPVPVLPYGFDNDGGATTAGLELTTRYRVSKKWQLEGTYALYSEKFYFVDGIPDFGGTQDADRAGSTPRNQIGLRSSLDLSHAFEFDGSVQYTEGTTVGSIPPWARVNLRVGWRPNPRTEFSLGGDNLLSQGRQEALSVYGAPDRIPRNLYVKVNFKF